MRAFPQFTLDDYLFNLSAARIQFLAIDNTHTKYLRGADKKAWENYGKALKAQSKFENFISGLNAPRLKEGEEYEIPMKKKKSKSK